jgi:hypothetical protein
VVPNSSTHGGGGHSHHNEGSAWLPGDSHPDWYTRLVWGLLGGMSVGWLVTLLTFWGCMRRARRDISQLNEQLAHRYEPIGGRA